MELLYDKFFDPRGYDVHGTLLISGEGRQLDWHVVRFDNGKELYTHHIDDVHVDLDFWETGALSMEYNTGRSIRQNMLLLTGK